MAAADFCALSTILSDGRAPPLPHREGFLSQLLVRRFGVFTYRSYADFTHLLITR